MRKKIIGIAFLMIATVAGTAMAQNTNDKCDAKCTKTECTSKKDCKKGGQDRHCEAKRGCSQAMLFEGLNLTDEQKTKIQDLNKEVQTTYQEARKAAKADKEALKAKKAEAKEARRDAQKERRAKYLNDLQEILTPEQFTTFLKNYYISDGPKGDKRPGMKGRPELKGDRKIKVPAKEVKRIEPQKADKK